MPSTSIRSKTGTLKSNLIRKPHLLTKGKNFSQFLITFKNWARLANIPDEDFIPTLLCYLSPELAERVTALDLTAEQLQTPEIGLPIVQKLVEGPQNFVTRRITLSKMKQGTQSITSYAEKLRTMALKCNFKTDAVKNTNLIQAFLSGLTNKEAAREVLKANPPPVELFEDAVNLAVTMALATEAVNSFNDHNSLETRHEIYPDADEPIYAIGQSNDEDMSHVEILQKKDAEIARLRTMCENSRTTGQGAGCWLGGGFSHFARKCPMGQSLISSSSPVISDLFG